MNSGLLIATLIAIATATYFNYTGKKTEGLIASGIAGGLALSLLLENIPAPIAFTIGAVGTVVFEWYRLKVFSSPQQKPRKGHRS
ncbi:hypothetical protein A3L04_03125 [Thermococcus chitonophagus]|uniref:Uncharacterized protein n=1 Tax=Thermococcus chitonophagus TaxID=54262 RepID=A0A2Z2N729_9EURY|nr:hypothetical protein [Thermococcus chitonophagus]ASJ16140.1 hypothetical protein A3L04_03125 [Thermococcus chitonophagus]